MNSAMRYCKINPDEKWRVCIIGGLLPPANEKLAIHISKIVKIFKPLVEKPLLIGRNLPDSIAENGEINVVNISPRYYLQHSIIVRIIGFIILQVELSYQIIKNSGKFETIYLSIDTPTLVLPALTAKILRKKILYRYPGHGIVRKFSEPHYKKTLFGMGAYILPPVGGFLEKVNRLIADRIVVYPRVINDPVLRKLTRKIFCDGGHFYIDCHSFTIKNELDHRDNLVAYVGQFMEVKGTMNFARAIPSVLNSSTAKIMIMGAGQQKPEVEQEIRKAGLQDNERVILQDWVSHDKLPEYLNNIKLLVIPSYIEVGPLIVFEAMACGTIVLSTPVGVIPGIIRDGITGFLMEDNSPECIARNIVRALNHPDLKEIVKNARELVENEYTFEAVVERYRRMLVSLEKGKEPGKCASAVTTTAKVS